MGQYKKSNNRRVKKKSDYSKFWVAFIITANTFFTIATFISFLRTGMEPSTLIGAWFSFTTVELWQLARIKNKKTERDMHEIRYGNKNEEWG